MSTGNREFLLRGRIDASVRYGHNNVDRVHAEKVVGRHCCQQLCPEHFRCGRWSCCGTFTRRNRKRMAVHYLGISLDHQYIDCLDNAKIWTPVEEVHG